MSEHIPSAQHPADKTLRSSATSLPFWRQLRWNLMFFFILLAILPVSIVAYVILARTSAQATNQVYDQLDSVAELKNAQITRWLGEGKMILSALVSGPNQDRFTAFITAKMPTPQEQADLTNMLIDAVSTRYFSKLFVYNVGGRVIASSDPADIGKMVDDQPYFEVSVYADYTQPPVADPTTGQMVMYTTRPLRIGKSDAVGVLAGQLDTGTLAEIMTERTGLGESGETYLVSLESNHMWTPSRFAGYELARAYHSQGIDQALGGKKGRDAYNNYRSYRFIPELRAALLAEVEQSQAMSTFRQAQLVGIGAAVAATLAAIVLGLLVAQQISRPVTALTETATRITSGDLSIRSTVKGQNEVGVLASAFNTMTDQLQDMISGLEQRVTERTTELTHRGEELEKLNQTLQAASQSAERRAVQLAARGQVTRAASQIRDPDQLLPEVTHLISQAFGYYHVGIFMADEAGRYAVLRAANSEGGQRMLARHHKLAVGTEGIVGYVVGTGQPRVALDVGADAAHFDNPDLPETRSEIALPLQASGRTFGALDVQSTQTAAFADEDVAILGMLADQVAIAIDNARLFAQTQSALQEAEETQRRYLRQEWERLMPALQATSHEYHASGVPPVGNAALPEIEQAIRQSDVVKITSQAAARSALAVPIKLRDQLIGVIDLHETEAEREWTADDVALVMAVADQAALALENARLLEQTEQRARREQLVTQIATKVRVAADVEGILRTGVQEIRRVLGASHGIVHLTTESLVSKTGEARAASAESQEGNSEVVTP
jgi:GAF domain-containing protein/HAMP domain-containing protein